jgi:hypothetical protein
MLDSERCRILGGARRMLGEGQRQRLAQTIGNRPLGYRAAVVCQ